MIKKIVIAAAVAATALSFASTASFAKKGKAKSCTMGQMMSGKPNSMGWAPVMGCGADGKMYSTLMMCYGPAGLCPPGL